MKIMPRAILCCGSGLAILVCLSIACTPTPIPTPTPTPTNTSTPKPTETPTETPIPVPAGYVLSWHDEFDGPMINPSNWRYETGGSGWGNAEWEYYTNRPENARIENGHLVIEARAEKYDINYYTSARLKTEGLRTFFYGRIEARLKVPDGQGMWPALWMLGSDFKGGNWPYCGEIDIMEYVGREPNKIFGTLHGPGYSGFLGKSKANELSYPIAADFHIYAIDWTKDSISWYFDGDKYSTVTRADVGDNDWPFNHPFFLIMNLAVGGSFPGLPDTNISMPRDYLVDYIRYYKITS
jgi:beta-glucanase (GH16 family)